LLTKHNIPWENIYNMDEKGVQLGGGQKNSGWKYFFSREVTKRYRQHSLGVEITSADRKTVD
ncbi:hypothetical protein F5890DRAFT_1400939, partial [Lentinula detonsa]